MSITSQFQSTLPVWGGTVYAPDAYPAGWISIHPPRVGRDAGKPLRADKAIDFNPPSPCGEGLLHRITSRTTAAFQSTLPVWGGTESLARSAGRTTISIHPPRVGRDPGPRRWRASGGYFNPPSPCGEGHQSVEVSNSHYRHFNPPSPCGEGRTSI